MSVPRVSDGLRGALGGDSNGPRDPFFAKVTLSDTLGIHTYIFIYPRIFRVALCS